MTQAEIKDIQRRIGVDDDGFWGPKSIAACQKHLRSLMPKPNPVPKQGTANLIAFYGQPGDESNLVNLPVTGVKYDGRTVKTIRCHKLCAETLSSILLELSEATPWLLELYAGCYNFRKMRGGSNWSLHAWGAAIDFDPARNGLNTHWPTRAVMPFTVMEIFARHGWLSAGAFWGRDAMHHQMTL
jgi:hypothetical protein